jgi:hypothetical protein
MALSPTAANAVLMVRPDHFAHNPETAATNAFQEKPSSGSADEVRRAAQREFDGMASALRARGVRVEVEPGVPGAPDAVFPNNWVSFHEDGSAVLYPLASPMRRREVRPELVRRLQAEGRARAGRIVDLSGLAERGIYLEGTGSLVLDRAARTAYACRSPRTDPRAVQRFAEELGYEPVLFGATDRGGRAIYHTNVMLAVGVRFAALAAEAVEDPVERRALLARLAQSKHELLEVTREQMHGFAGNLIELAGAGGAPTIAMSTRALRSLRRDQRERLEGLGEIVAVDLDTIERVGGGSARCMLAELAWGPAEP